MQPFKAEGRFAFSHAQSKRRREDRIDVGVLNDEVPAGKVGVEVKLEALRKSATQVRSQAAEGKRVHDLLARISQSELAVGLNQQSDLQPVIAFRTLQNDTLTTQRCFLRGSRGGRYPQGKRQSKNAQPLNSHSSSDFICGRS